MVGAHLAEEGRMNRSVWRGSSTVVEKPWGTERTWNGLFCGKEIAINKGHRTSLKFNSRKNELLFLQKGELFVEFADEQHFNDSVKYPAQTCRMKSGDLLNVQAGCPYRLSALQDCVLFEISDSNSSIGGKVIIDDDYGRETNAQGKFIFNRSKD